MAVRREEQNSSQYPVASLAKRVLHLFRDVLDEELRPCGVTAAQLHVLFKLEDEPGISGAKLARTCKVTPQTTQVLLRGIERNGWIARTRHPENDRILLATLTPLGKRTLASSRKAVGHIYKQMLRNLTPREVRKLEALLSHCAANLESSSSNQSLQPKMRKRKSQPRRFAPVPPPISEPISPRTN
jgi:MarR family transcriptional regulator, organic hydroperoxide resistance regulator